jgi:glycerol-3-phosphate dehydrogenase
MSVPGTNRPSLEAQHFQVLVIGGGINGVAIARQCARAGRRTLLVEQNDFAAGTTSRSTRLIHGGLRYLEQGDIGQVRESLRERQSLLRTHPHLVHPIQFVMALGGNSRRSALQVRTGLWLYRQFGGRKLGPERAEQERGKLERLLDSGQRWATFDFEDAQCEFPERLVAEWLVDAGKAGAVIRNHTQVLAIDIANGRAKGALLRDQITGKDERVEAAWIINATGPWIDQLCQRSRVRTQQPLVGGVRGSHIVLPRFAGAPDAAVYAEAVDGRPVFVIPWNDQLLVGTTEVPDHSDPAKTAPTADEIDYLLKSLLRIFPRARVTANDIRYSFAGIRPLPYSPKSDPHATTRRHFLHDHAGEGAARLISIVGGKLTTAAKLARQCASRIGIPLKRQVPVATPIAESIDPMLDSWVLQIAEAAGVSETSAKAIAEWHGPRTVAIAQMARSSPEMRAPLCRHSEHIVAEAMDAFANEYAISMADVLLRRVPVALGGCWSDACSRDATSRIRAAMGWTDEHAAAELESFEMERAAFLRRPRVEVPLEAAAD